MSTTSSAVESGSNVNRGGTRIGCQSVKAIEIGGSASVGLYCTSLITPIRLGIFRAAGGTRGGRWCQMLHLDSSPRNALEKCEEDCTSLDTTLGKLQFMAPSPNPGAPSGFKDAQPPRGDEGCTVQSHRGPPTDFYSFDTLTSDSGASPIDPLSTALDVLP